MININISVILKVTNDQYKYISYFKGNKPMININISVILKVTNDQYKYISYFKGNK